jgi:hypothetical protein
MIDELITNVSYVDKVAKGIAYQSTLLPDPATKPETMSGRSGERMKTRTIAVGP